MHMTGDRGPVLVFITPWSQVLLQKKLCNEEPGLPWVSYDFNKGDFLSVEEEWFM